MKLWLTLRNLPRHPNPNRIILSNTLYLRHSNRLPIRNTHLPRRQLWLSSTLPTRQRSIHVFHLLIPTRRSWPLLRILYLYRNLKRRYPTPFRRNSNSLHRLCAPMRPNILLRGYRHYQPTLGNPLHRNHPRRMNLRGILSRQSYPNTILRLPLPPPLHYCSPSNSPPPIPSRNWLKQSNRNPIRHRHNPLPPLPHNQRRTRHANYTPCSPNTSFILTRPIRRPRQLYSSQPTKHPSTYQTRVILPICIRYPTIHPK